MFLPGRSVEEEKRARHAAFRTIEDICENIIGSDMASQCSVSVQEIQCGDPNCAPIDTLVTIQFTSYVPNISIEITPQIVDQHSESDSARSDGGLLFVAEIRDKQFFRSA